MWHPIVAKLFDAYHNLKGLIVHMKERVFFHVEYDLHAISSLVSSSYSRSANFISLNP